MNLLPGHLTFFSVLTLVTAATAVASEQPATRVVARPSASAPVRTLVLSSFQKREARLVEWTASGVRIADASVPEELARDAARETLPTSKLLAMFADSRDVSLTEPSSWSGDELDLQASASSGATVSVTLVDGQRLIGTLLAHAEEADTKKSDTNKTDSNRDDAATGLAPPASDVFTVRAGVLGDIHLKLDDVAEIESLTSPPPTLGGRLDAGSSEAPSSDTVVLANGDRLTGFIESLGAQVSISVESGDKAPSEVSHIPLSRCRSVLFANPRSRLSGPAAWIAADGGELHAVKSASYSASPSGESSLELRVDRIGGKSLTVPTVLVVAVTPEAAKVVALSSLEAPTYEADASRRWTHPPVIERGRQAPLGLGDVTLPGAMRAEWTLPRDVVGAIGSVRLAPEARMWGECTVELTIQGDSGSEVVWKAEIDPEHPSHEVAIDFSKSRARTGSPTRMQVRVNPGRLGGIQDRIVLEQFMLVRADTAAAGSMSR